MSRFNVIDLAQLGEMVVLEKLDSEAVIAARMLQFKQAWSEHDPPAGAQYDVENLEFDPVRILQEANAYFELLLRDRVNQAARAVTLAYAISTDLDAIASNFPVGQRLPVVPSPRPYAQAPIDYESDDRYRRRTQLSLNALSPHGAAGAYMYWALTADPNLKDASETGIEGTGEVILTIMDDDAAEPRPSHERLLAIRSYIHAEYRKAATDILTVVPPRVIDIDYEINVWLLPPPDRASKIAQIEQALRDMATAKYWLGVDHTRMDIFHAVKQEGVHRAEIVSPTADVLVTPRDVVRVNDIRVTFAGRSE